jgi:hypothetical protein
MGSLEKFIKDGRWTFNPEGRKGGEKIDHAWEIKQIIYNLKI